MGLTNHGVVKALHARNMRVLCLVHQFEFQFGKFENTNNNLRFIKMLYLDNLDKPKHDT
jgi:hypothetical protein